jgi:hypothetical protein
LLNLVVGQVNEDPARKPILGCFTDRKAFVHNEAGSRVWNELRGVRLVGCPPEELVTLKPSGEPRFGEKVIHNTII